MSSAHVVVPPGPPCDPTPGRVVATPLAMARCDAPRKRRTRVAEHEAAVADHLAEECRTSVGIGHAVWPPTCDNFLYEQLQGRATARRAVRP